MFEHDFTDAHESHKTLILTDIHISLRQKQLTALAWVHSIYFEPENSGEEEEIQLKTSGRRYLRIKRMDVNLFKMSGTAGTSSVPLPIDHRSTIIVKDTK